MTLCFLRDLRVLRGETSSFIKHKEFTIKNLTDFSSIKDLDNGRTCRSGKNT
jgi:hypothetical protein